MLNFAWIDGDSTANMIRIRGILFIKLTYRDMNLTLIRLLRVHDNIPLQMQPRNRENDTRLRSAGLLS